MDSEKRRQKSIREYEYLRRSVFVHRYDFVGRILVAIVFVVAAFLFITSPRQPETWADYREWMIAFSVIVSAVFLASMVSDLMLAKILMEEVDRLKDQIHALDADACGDERARSEQGEKTDAATPPED